MKKTLSTTFALFCFTLCMQAHATTYYFSSSDGNDNRSPVQAQSPSSPWKSLVRLNSIFGGLQPGDVILFKRGDVFTGTIIPTASGTASQPIVLGAYGTGDAPVINGLVTVTGFISVSANVWETTAPLLPSGVNVVVVNGVVKPIGRYPNASAANDGYLSLETHSGNSSITDQQLSAFPNWTGGEVVIRKNRWVLDRNKISLHAGNTISYISQSGYHASDNYGYFIQNHRATLDQAGEWFYNDLTKHFGIYSNTAPTGIEASSVSTLLSITNQNNITISDLVFKGANNNAVECNNTQNVKLLNCEILYSGANAVLALGCNGLRIEGCKISESANTALEMRNSHNTIIKGNQIKNSGIVAGMGKGDSGSYEGILIDGDNETIEGNEIDNTGYIAITFRGNTNIIKNNFIKDHNKVKDDGGGIYTWNNIAGAAPTYGSKIIGNIVLNGIGASAGTDDVLYKAANGIYMDDNTAGVEIANNSVANCGLFGLYVHNGYGLTITGNTFYNSGSQAVFAHDNYAPNAKLRNITATNNLFFSKEAWQMVAEFKTPDDDLNLIGNFTNNYYCRPAYENYIINTAVNADAINLDLAEWKALYGKDAGSQSFPAPAVSYDAIRFEYNAEATPKTISLDGTYTDASNNLYNGNITLQPYSSAVLVKQAASFASCANGGTIKREQWNNTINGDLDVVPWQAAPSKTTTITGAFEAANIGDAYASRLSGFICPPQSGSYTFWIAGDDFAELWLSTNESPSTKRKIAGLSGWTYLRDWNKNTSQRSVSINLQAGTKYYIEVVQKEGNGGDHVSVAWQLPSGQMEAPIPGYRISSGGNTQALQNQTINFPALPNVTLGSPTITLSATASSHLPVSFTLVSGPATLNGNMLAVTGMGTVIIKAAQAGNAQYNPAADVVHQFLVVPTQTNSCSATGSILREQWGGVGGNDIAQIPLTVQPTSSSQLTLFEGPKDAADNYGSRIRGYICAPQTGNYTFWIAGDDATELWLSTSDNAATKVKIAYSNSWTSYREWNRYASQKSSLIYLEGGKKYYIEALQKEGAGGDHLSVAWQLPNGEMEAPIKAAWLSPFQGSAQINQTINFSSLPNFTLGTAPLILSATASSGLPVSFSVVSGAATLTGNVLAPTAAGVVVIKASQSGNAVYSAATDVLQTLTVVAVTTPTIPCSATGSILREQWNSVGGNDVSQIPVSLQPSVTAQINFFEGPKDAADSYGSRIRGYICAPQTGNYFFSIAGDDATELWLSTDDSPLNKRRIAYSTSWTYHREWNRYASQKSVAIHLEAGKKYYIEALQKEGGGGDHLSVAWEMPNGIFEGPIAGSRLSPFVNTTPVETSPCSTAGYILREQWSGVAGNDIGQIPLTVQPTSSSQLSLFEGPKDAADNYGSRIRGYICAPQTGNYTFWIAGDDATELWLSTTDNAATKVKIAYSYSWTNYREWNRYASQKSATVHLQAGTKYYIEALQKEGSGGDNLSVGWQLPDGTSEMPVLGKHLSPFEVGSQQNTKAYQITRTLEIEKSKPEELMNGDSFTCYPNPFSTSVTIEIKAAETGTSSVEIFDVAGRKIAILFNGQLQKGAQRKFVWKTLNRTSGVYFVRYTSGRETRNYKLIAQ